MSRNRGVVINGINLLRNHDFFYLPFYYYYFFTTMINYEGVNLRNHYFFFTNPTLLRQEVMKTFRKILGLYSKLQFCPQLTYMTSCGWWKVSELLKFL